MYWALVVGVPSIEEGLIDLPLAKQPGTGGEKMHVDEENGQSARTRWRMIDRAGNRAAWMELQPLTGRTHQIRVHMQAIKHPCVGDPTYGGDPVLAARLGLERQWLHAVELAFVHPRTGDEVRFTSGYPEDLAEALRLIRT